MKAFRAQVRVPAPNGVGTMVVWAEVHAANPIAARVLLFSMYGYGNVISVPVMVA